jgi:hypothetical protein
MSLVFFRYGYNSLNNTKQVWSRTREAGIPLVSTSDMLFFFFKFITLYNGEMKNLKITIAVM